MKLWILLVFAYEYLVWDANSHLNTVFLFYYCCLWDKRDDQAEADIQHPDIHKSNSN